MKRDASSQIPCITADFITATTVIADLAVASLRQKCAVIQAVADRGKQFDELTVGELMKLAQETR